MDKLYPLMTVDKAVQTNEAGITAKPEEEKLLFPKSRSLVILGGPRYSKILRIPRIHPATRFMVKLAYEISK